MSSSDAATFAVMRRPADLRRLTVRCVDGAFTTEDSPLDSAEPGARRLLDAWQKLAKVAVLEPEHAAAVQTILDATVTDPFGDNTSLGPLEVQGPHEAPAPTAGHPRAFRGTKWKPPKPAQPEPTDLRLWLCTASGTARVLERIRSAVGVEIHAPTQDAMATAAPDLRHAFGWLVSRDAEQAVRYATALLDAQHELQLSTDPQLRFALVSLAIGRGLPMIVRWLSWLARIPPSAVRVRVVTLLDNHPVEAPDETLTTLVTWIADRSFDDGDPRLQKALQWIHADAAIDHVLATLDFSLVYSRPDALRLLPLPLRPSTLNSIETLIARTEAHAIDVHGLGFGAGLDPNVEAFVDRLASSELTGKAITSVHRLACSYDGVANTEASADLDRLLRCLMQVEVPWQEKAARILAEVYYEEAAELLETAEVWIRRSCRKPHDTDPNSAHLIIGACRIVHAQAAAEDVATTAAIVMNGLDDAAIKTIERLGRSSNAAWATASGFESLADAALELCFATLTSDAAALCQTARCLGSLSAPDRRRLIKRSLSAGVAQHELPPAADASLQALRDAVTALRDRGAPESLSRIPRQLRDAVDEDVALSKAQRRRHLERLRAQWPAIAIERIRHDVLLTLRERVIGLPLPDAVEDLSDGMRHALLLQTGMVDNHRALRRLLRAIDQGEPNPTHEHPANVAWRASTPSIDHEAWRDGIEHHCEVEGFGAVRIAFERDPIEALRLGSYVGSCLGIGGSCVDSAAAIVLDANKQVAFARDSKGRFIGRQVLAITNDCRLACYTPYPLGATTLHGAFGAFARALSERVGAPLVVPKDDENDDDSDAEVSLIIANDWWDDGIWAAPQAD